MRPTVQQMQSQLSAWSKLYRELKQLDYQTLLDRINKGEDWLKNHQNHPKVHEYARAHSMMKQIYDERMGQEILEAMQ